MKHLFISIVAISLVLLSCNTGNDITELIKNGDIEEVKKLLAKDFHPTDTIGDRTYFEVAVYEGQLEILKEFFKHSGELLESYQKQDLVFLSIKENKREIYNYLFKDSLFEDHKEAWATVLSLLEDSDWDDEFGRLMLINNDVNIFYDFIQKHHDNERYTKLMPKLFKRHWPVYEAYIGSIYHENNEYEEYEGYEDEAYENPDGYEPEFEYLKGNYNSLISKIEDRYSSLNFQHFSANKESKRVLLSFDENANKIFNNFYHRVFVDKNFEKYTDTPDPRDFYTGTVSRRIPLYLPFFSRFCHPFKDENDLNKMHNSDKQLFAYIFHRLDRSSFIIKWMWEAWKETVFSNISTRTYFKKGFYDYTEALIRTYDSLTSRERYKEHLADAYDKIASCNHDFFYACIIEEVRYREDGWRIDWNWAPGFWIRRFHEGNEEVVYNILKEISAHYAGNELNKLIKIRHHKEIKKVSYLAEYRLLMNEGAEVDLLVGKNGVTKLHVAALKDNIADIKKLVKEGEDVNVRDDDNNSPLYYASKLETVKLLVESGALVPDTVKYRNPIADFNDRKLFDIVDFLEGRVK